MNKLAKLDWILLTSVILLMAIGMLALYSISFRDAVFSPVNFEKQLISIAIGIVLLFFFAFYDYRTLGLFSTKLYFFIVIILILVIFLGTTVRGTTGWIGLGTFNIQPVELAKLIMIIFIASFFSKKMHRLSEVVRTIASIILVFIPTFLILRQPDFGSAAIIVSLWAVLLLVCGINKKTIFILFLIATLCGAASWSMLRGYQKERLVNFINPANDPRGSGYNVLQSIVAVGSGGIWGKGLGHGSQSQLNFLPEKHTDFIFAVIAEELGFFGAGIVFFLFALIFYRIKEIARSARDNFGYLLAVGILVMLFFQLLINIGMNIGIMPVAGVPLPFLSYGGSSLVTMLASIGILESIYLRREKNID